MRGKQIKDFNFREITYKPVLIFNDRNLAAVRYAFGNALGYDIIMAYGYIDHTAGISFEVLSMVKIDDTGIHFSEGDSHTSMKMRYDSITGTILPFDKITPAMQSKIEMINNGYQVNDAVLKARNTTDIDSFRHPQFPDDVLLMFVTNNIKAEGIWCRVEDEIDGCPAARMMNEPYGDFGVHQGDLVPFGWTDVDGKITGIAMFPNPEEIEQEEENTEDIIELEEDDIMNEQLKTYIEQVFGLCDNVDDGPLSVKNTIGKDVKLRDLLEMSMIQYLLYLSASDGTIAWQEANFINQYLGYHITPEKMNDYIKDNNIYSTEFEQDVPLIFKYMVEVDNILYEKGENKPDTYSSELLFQLYGLMGLEFIKCDGDEDDNEKTDFNIYLNMIKNYIDEHLKSRHQDIKTGFTKNTGSGVAAPSKNGSVSAPKKKG